ncbi:LIM and calponin homology domains-containing protein 1-like isoform X7 [Nelusetta ayraudi]|uniref:LIM and calponin homology domains-containing protein 1-like isoform X7 n=1 Tax=Nelusetta ayraudi TaxID=303726 RepID=UPI003F713ECF
MASPVAGIGASHQHHPASESAADSAFQEAQKWIEAVTGRCFGDRDFRGALENGILLCELLSSIKPALVKKINRLPTPIAGLDNLGVFLRGCEELGLKGSQLFDPGDLQDTSTRPAAKGSDCSRKLKNVLITIYWLGRAANCCTSYSGPTLDLKEFEGLLAQMRKEAEEAESPKRSIRDSGYIDCWDSERSDSLSPPRHGREDSFDSLDSLGSRSRQTPSPDVPVTRGSSDGRGSDSESDGAPHRKLPDIRKDDMSARRTSVTELRTVLPFNQYLPNKSNQTGYVPTPLRKKKGDREEGGRKSWSTATSPVGGDRPFRSVSMIDMRDEDEAALRPHSQLRHERMHNQYNRIREEDNHWQNDLAKWKNRRRSISQDLIKKEEERKMMEQLMTGETHNPARRRSIKTYREIVEDKERREEELRDAYRRARSHEEASSILQRYAQRFSISETVLERLQLPKLLDRSVSADPSLPCSPFPLSLSLTASPTTPDPFDEDPEGPLRFLRQQSAPPPKFTSTLEARIEEFPKEAPHQRPQIRSRSSEPPASRGLSSKPLPLLMPKPFLQSRPSAPEQWSNKGDGFHRVNGDVGGLDASPGGHGRESPNDFQPSPSLHSPSAADAPSPALSPHAAGGGQSLTSTEASGHRGGTEAARQEAGREEVTEHSTPPSRPTSLPEELQKAEESGAATGNQSEGAPVDETNSAPQQTPSTDAKDEREKSETEVKPGVGPQQSHAVSLQTSVAVSQQSSQQERQSVPKSSPPGPSGYHPPTEKTAEAANSLKSPPATSNPKLRWDFFAPPEGTEKECRGNVSAPVLPQARRADRWSWDPDEERKRQERWQQEQERMLQEKYQREQQKLKEEWEKAQQEVAEEGRKYHEEERRILEQTVAPLTPRSSAVSSPSRGEVSSAPAPQDTIVRSLADWERKQELLERQSGSTADSAEAKQRKNDRTSDISTADDSMRTGRSLASQGSSQAETLSHNLQNGQKAPPTSAKGTPAKKQPEAPADKTSRPAGDRRVGPVDSNAGHSGSSKAPTSPADTVAPPPNRSVSGKKLCSSCGQPLGKGAAMIIETLSLYFHIQCFKCGVCKGQLGDTTTGTDVRIRNGLLNCHQCYIRSRSAGQPTTL